MPPNGAESNIVLTGPNYAQAELNNQLHQLPVGTKSASKLSDRPWPHKRPVILVQPGGNRQTTFDVHAKQY